MADPAPSSNPRKFSESSSALANDTPSHSASRSISSAHSGSLSHRSSFAENMRNAPPSPRQRHSSFTQAALQELLNHPPAAGTGDKRFAGRDWRQIHVGELVETDQVRFVEIDTAVEAATKLLTESGAPNVVLIRSDAQESIACDTFDYSDLNAYLLVVLGAANPSDEEQVRSYSAIAEKARGGATTTLDEIKHLAQKPPLVFLSEDEDLSKAVEIFAGGVHRILITKEGSSKVIGILSQWRLVKFLWDNGASFPAIDQLYPTILRDLSIGSHQIIFINGDKPLIEALQLMYNEGLTSLAVVDNAQNVVGNISTVDVKHLTNTSSLPLLKSSCIHFISVILSERGMENGKDSFPVFHVNPYSTLAYTVSKLVATKSHRMWVVESASPSPSAPATPAAAPAVLAQAPGSNPAGSPGLTPGFPAVSAAALPGSHMSGRLSGVISLTDVLNLFATQTGLSPLDPREQRKQRRRSSSISVRPSIDSVRGSIDLRR
ncbi:MAG: cell separation during budding [Claussenomyces sp. TS43310]|nr:MAG: cell separation during budding [Claussenomyces sp. TS43310]